MITLHIFLFHTVSAIGIILSNIVEIDSFRVYDGACAALCQTRFIRTSDNRSIAYSSPPYCENFIHDEVSSVLSNAIFKLPMQIVMNCVS